MLTAEMRERAAKLLADARVMGDSPARCEYDVGEYWRLCDEVHEFLTDLLQCDGKPMAAASVNPLFEAEKET